MAFCFPSVTGECILLTDCSTLVVYTETIFCLEIVRLFHVACVASVPV